MNFPARRKSRALLICYGFACLLFGGHSVAQEQALAPLRVNPALLGLPPIKPAEAPVIAPVAPPATADKGPEVKPVQAVVVEPKAVDRAPEASESARARKDTSLETPSHQPRGEGQQAAPVAPVPQMEKQPRSEPQAPTVSQVQSAKPVARQQAQPASRKPAETDKSWFQRVWSPVANAYNNGALEFYLPLKTYHSRSTYSQEQIDSYQENPLGFGIGRGLYNEKGNWEGVFAMAFQDSHFKPSYTGGYQWKAIWRPAEDVRLGLGYLAGLMSRSDILSYVPCLLYTSPSPRD